MRWRDALVLSVVAAIIALLGFGLTLDPDDLPSPLVGEAAPPFGLEPLDGGDTLRLADLAGHPVVMNFWASWCLACIQEHPALVRAWGTYRDRGVRMVGVVYQDRPENARRYLRKHGGGWAQLLDPGTRTAIDYGVYGVPETFFIDVEGRVTHKHIGPVTDQVMDREIGALLGKPALDEGASEDLETGRGGST